MAVSGRNMAVSGRNLAVSGSVAQKLADKYNLFCKKYERQHTKMLVLFTHIFTKVILFSKKVVYKRQEL